MTIGVIGAGIVGLSTALALLQRGADVVVYERGVPGNGQSGGESRIFRHAHEDRRLVAFAREARGMWREWEEHFGEELLARDGVVAVGPAVERRLAVLQQDGGVRARTLEPEEVADWLPLMAPTGAPTAADEARAAAGVPAMVDEDGGVIRVRAVIEALTEAVGDALVLDEVLSVRETAAGMIEVRAGGVWAEHERVVLCAGRGTVALARGAGLPLPVRQAAHVRLTFPVRGEPPPRLACLLDGRGAYGDPLPGNQAYAVGLGEAPVHEDGSLADPGELGRLTDRTVAYVARALPGLEPTPIDVRHCWVTELPWSPDGIAVWEHGALLAIAGGNLFKHAPALGRALAVTALGDELRPDLRPYAKLGAARP